MKKMLVLMLVVVLVATMFVGCSNTSDVQDAQAQDADAQGEKTFKVGMIPKFTGVDYFIACENGARKAAEDFGIELDWQGDPSGQESAANQQAYIQTFIDKEYDAILVSALDQESYADTLKAAREKGILVISWDADVNPDARDFFVNQTENSDIGVAMMEGLAANITDGGTVAVVSTDPNASNQNAWIAAIRDEYEANKDAKYAGIKFHDDIIYAGNDQAKADIAVSTLLTQNPDLKGVFGLATTAAPAVAKAVEDAGMKPGDISIAAIAVPVTSVEDMKSGVMPSAILWQPYDLGYLTIELTADLLNGKVDNDMTSYTSSLSGTSQVGEVMYSASHKITEDKQVILGPAIAYGLDTVQYFKGYPEPTSGLE